VDHEARGEVEPRRGLGITEGASAQLAARLEQLRTGGTVDGAVDTPAPEERRIRRVHDRMDVLGDDVAQHDLEQEPHAPQRRFPQLGAAGPERTDAGLGPGLADPGGSPRREEETPCARVHDRS